MGGEGREGHGRRERAAGAGDAFPKTSSPKEGEGRKSAQNPRIITASPSSSSWLGAAKADTYECADKQQQEHTRGGSPESTESARAYARSAHTPRNYVARLERLSSPLASSPAATLWEKSERRDDSCSRERGKRSRFFPRRQTYGELKATFVFCLYNLAALLHIRTPVFPISFIRAGSSLAPFLFAGGVVRRVVISVSFGARPRLVHPRRIIRPPQARICAGTNKHDGAGAERK